jgi:hypothetical protein
MAEITAKPKPTAKSPASLELHALSVRVGAIPLTGVLDRTSGLSDEVLGSLETSERAAIEAVGQFVITIEEALPEEVAATSEVAKKITESGLQMADRLVHTGHDLLRSGIDSIAKSLSAHNGAKAQAAH